jgi:hypothetical protein
VTFPHIHAFAPTLNNSGLCLLLAGELVILCWDATWFFQEQIKRILSLTS